jgi:hypothetical protein
MWKQLSNEVSPWWKHSDNESYIYYNRGDGQVGFYCCGLSCINKFRIVFDNALSFGLKLVVDR